MKKGKMMENEKRCVNCEYRYEEDGNLIFTNEECEQCAGFITGYRNFKEKIELPKCRCTTGVVEMKKKDVYNNAKATWGIDGQVTKAIEELAELQKELCKFLLDDGIMENIVEEIADVKIMVEQLELILECKDKVKEFKKAKIQRLSDRLDAEQPKYLTFSCEHCKHKHDGRICFNCSQYSEYAE